MGRSAARRGRAIQLESLVVDCWCAEQLRRMEGRELDEDDYCIWKVISTKVSTSPAETLPTVKSKYHNDDHCYLRSDGVIDELLISDKGGNNKLHQACKDPGMADFIDRLLTVEPLRQLFQKNKRGEIPLHVAIESKQSLQVIEKLLAFDGDGQVLQQTAGGSSPLHLACYWGGRVELAKLLLQHNREAQLGLRDIRNASPIHIACRYASTDLCRVLLSHRPIEQVLRNGNGGRIPLHCACLNKDSDQLVPLLLSYKPQRQIMTLARNKTHRLPLHYASEHCNPDIVRRFLRYMPKKQVLQRDGSGRIPLHYAVENFEAEEVVNILLQYVPEQQVLVATSSEDGCPPKAIPLHIACDKFQLGVARSLLAYRPTEQVLVPDYDNRLPLHLACGQHDEKICEILLEHVPQEQMMHRDSCGKTPLHVACKDIYNFLRKGRDMPRAPAVIARLCLSLDKHQAFLKWEGKLPIHVASQSGLDRVVAALLAVDPQRQVLAEDEEGNLPLHLGTGNSKTIELLLQYEPKSQLLHENSEGHIPIEVDAEGLKGFSPNASLHLFFMHEAEEQLRRLEQLSIPDQLPGWRSKYTYSVEEMFSEGSLAEEHVDVAARFLGVTPKRTAYYKADILSMLEKSQSRFKKFKSARSAMPQD